MVAHVSLVVDDVVLVVLPSTTPAYDVVALQISADSVLQLDGFSGVGTGPFVGIVSVGQGGSLPLMVMPGGHLIPGGPPMYGPGGSGGKCHPKTLRPGHSMQI